MSKRIYVINVIVFVSMLMIGAVTVWALPRNVQADFTAGQGAGREPLLENSAWPAPVLESEDLSESEEEALRLALDDEYKAWSVYEQVIADFGAVRPFTSVQGTEENHIAALVTPFERYGLNVPGNEWPGDVPTFDTLVEACAAGVQAEIDNAALYDELFSMVDNADIIRVFAALQEASQTKHLLAFERCAR